MLYTYVITAKGTRKPVTDLGWLMHNKNKHGGIANVLIEKREEKRGSLTVIFEDSTIYYSDFMNFEVMFNWVQAYLFEVLTPSIIDFVIHQYNRS